MRGANYNAGETIWGAEALDDLPVGAVVLDCHGSAWQRLIPGWQTPAMQQANAKTSRELWAHYGRIRTGRRLQLIHPRKATP